MYTGRRATAALAFLLTEEFSEAEKSMERCIACLFIGISEKNETSHQPSYGWDCDVFRADRSRTVSSKADRGLVEGGMRRRAKRRKLVPNTCTPECARAGFPVN